MKKVSQKRQHFSRAAGESHTAQKRGEASRKPSFADNRPAHLAQRKLIAGMQQASKAGPIQRMLKVDGSTLYYTKSTLGFTDDRSKKQSVKEGEWVTNVEDATGLKTTDITASNFNGLQKIKTWSATNLTLVKTQLENNDTAYGYSSYYGLNSESKFNSVQNSDVTKLLRPKDWLTESSDISGSYDISLACVLQALVNQGATIPDFGGSKGKDDYEKFHNWMRENGYADYDLDYIVYKYYTSIGVSLVVNSITAWKNLKLNKGKYIFTKKGHNFAVTVKKDLDRPDQWVINDKPQNFMSYNADEAILYVWKV